MRLTYDLNWYFEDVFGGDENKHLPLSDKVEMLRKHIFNFEYPVDDKYRENLETVFIYRFWFKEIGFENYTRWHYELQTMMNVNGYRYNQLFKSKLDDLEQAINMIDVTGVATSDSEQDTTTSATGTGDSKGKAYVLNKTMDTPQGRNTMSDTHISSLSDNENVNESVSNNVENGKQGVKAKGTVKNTSKGYSGVPLFELYRRYNESMLIATDVIIVECANLFLGVVI